MYKGFGKNLAFGELYEIASKSLYGITIDKLAPPTNRERRGEKAPRKLGASFTK